MNMTLNIKEVTLYKSGVGFFLADCPNAQFTLPVNEEDINDVLKSLSVNGLKSVRFSSAEEHERIIDKIGIQLDPQNALFSACQHLIGCTVEIEIGKDEKFNGIVIGVDELQDDSLDISEELIEESLSEVLVLKVDDEIRHIPFNGIKGIAIKNKIIQNDLEKFLDFVSNSRKAGVTILQVDAEENSWATWVMPISSWRLSYRILFDEEEKELNLYGIAVVDNTTSIDWKDIVLRLVTGKPVSFQYDLYNPLYFERPEIEREVKGVAPIVSEVEGIFDFEEEAAEEMEAMAPPPPRMRGPPGAPPSPTPKRAEKKKMAMEPMAKQDSSLDKVVQEIRPTIEATRQEIGTAIAYVVGHPITINRSQSALIPILNEQLSGESSVILRDDRINEAMDALVLKEPIDLEKAPATVYIDGIFAGDAMIIGGTDYITFRLNQEINAMKEISTKTTTKSIAVEGVYLNITVTHERNYTFKLVNRSKETVNMLLEIEKYSDFHPQEKPDAETSNYYRYQFSLKPGNSVKKYHFQSISHQYEQIAHLSSYQLEEYLNSDLLSKSDKTELLELISLYNSFNKKMQEQKQIQREIEKEFENQERIRENIIVVKDEAELQKDYLQKLKNSEQHLDNLKIELNKIKSEIKELKQKMTSAE
ncbi:MAG: DUF4139 domain-containing protein [Candidatus Heimdallarchaeota archaeon]|nr:DUF4139 domain-containing protein [Candidatus Heimdallarchaeota archaeon]